jgi:hypothetical protein
VSLSEALRNIDALAQIVAFAAASLLPLLAVGAAFSFSQRMRLAWRTALLIGVNLVSFPVAFVVLMELALTWSPSGRPGPGMGIIAVPMLNVWLLAVAVSTVLLIGLIIGRLKRADP